MPHRIMKERDHHAQALENAIELCNYNNTIRLNVLDWFQNSILPFLRPGAKTKWSPHLTRRNSPFELSINTRGDGPKDRTVQFTIEAIGPGAGTEKDRWNQNMQREILSGIRGKVEGLDLVLFDHFSKAFFITAKDEWRTLQPIPKTSPSCFLAFDLHHSKNTPNITTKAHFFPQLKSLQTGISPGSLVEESISLLHNNKSFDIQPALDTVMAYLQEPGSVLTLNDVDMLSTDCIALDQNPRIKIYARTWRNTFAAAEDIYTLGGQLPHTQDLVALEDFWTTIFHPDSKIPADWKSVPATPLSESPRSCFLYAFELTSGEPLPKMEVHVPMWCLALSDAALQRRLDGVFAMKGWNGLVGMCEKDVHAVLSVFCPGGICVCL
jgi:DMATS type aromatic prenyltransferase